MINFSLNMKLNRKLIKSICIFYLIIHTFVAHSLQNHEMKLTELTLSTVIADHKHGLSSPAFYNRRRPLMPRA